MGNNNSKYCSKKCKYLFQKTLTGEKSINWQGGISKNVTKICLYCNKSFTGLKNRIYCSVSCSVKINRCNLKNIKKDHKGSKNPRWLGNNIVTVCPQCNTEFEQRPIKKPRKYCSKKCFNKSVSIRLLNGDAAIMNSKIRNISTPQIKLFEMVKEIMNGVELNYPSKNFAIDIAVPKKMLAIEYDGSYWHKNKRKDCIRQNILEKEGWKFLRYIDFIPSKENLVKDIKSKINM